MGARRGGHQDRPGRQRDDRRRSVHAGDRPDERCAVRPPEPVRLRRDHRSREPDLQSDRRRPGAAAAARSDARHGVRRGRLHQDQRQGPQPRPADQRQHRPGRDVVQGAVDQWRHRDDGVAAQQPAVHRRLLRHDRRRAPRSARHAQRHHGCTGPVHGPHGRSASQHGVRRQGTGRPARVRCHPSRGPPRRDRELPHRRRSGARPDRDDRPDRRDRRRVDDLVHHAVHADLLPQRLRQLHARRRDVPRRVVLRGRHHRRSDRRHAVRRRGALGDLRRRDGAHADVDQQLRRRHVVGRRDHQVRRLRRWAQPVDEQPQRRRLGRPGICPPTWSGGARPAERHPAEVEPGPQPAGRGGVRDLRDRRRTLDHERHRLGRRPPLPASAHCVLPLRRGLQHGAEGHRRAAGQRLCGVAKLELERGLPRQRGWCGHRRDGRRPGLGRGHHRRAERAAQHRFDGGVGRQRQCLGHGQRAGNDTDHGVQHRAQRQHHRPRDVVVVPGPGGPAGPGAPLHGQPRQWQYPGSHLQRGDRRRREAHELQPGDRRRRQQPRHHEVLRHHQRRHRQRRLRPRDRWQQPAGERDRDRPDRRPSRTPPPPTWSASTAPR